MRLAGRMLWWLSEDRPASVAVNWVPEAGRRRRGRLQMTWRTTFWEDVKGMRVMWRGAARVANDRQQ